MHTDPQTCLNCSSHRSLTDAGLCSRCHYEMSFVVRPEAHREHHRRRTSSQPLADLEQLGILTTGYSRDNSLRICDLCNGQISVTGEHTLIPLIGSYALCIPCATGFPYWPDAWTTPIPRTCRCAACQRPVLAALATLARLS